MREISQKKELRLSLLWIAVYVVVFTICENISEMGEFAYLIKALVSIILVCAIWRYIRKNDAQEYYGFTKINPVLRKNLWMLIPFIILASINLWNGVHIRMTALEIAMSIVSMLCIGFIEEVIFRGFLFKAMLRENIKTAVIISSITFGLGHIVNLLNGAEFLPTILQIIYAAAIGFMFAMFVLKMNYIYPCIACHGLVNALSIFNSGGHTIFYQIVVCIIIVILAGGFGIYLSRIEE